MNTDWVAVRTGLVAILKDVGQMQLFEPTIVELLVDMQAVAPVEYQGLKAAMKSARVATEIEREMKRYRFKEPSTMRGGVGAQPGEKPRIERTYDRHASASAVIEELVARPDVYVQGTSLVRVTTGSGDGVPHIQRLATPTALELITAVVTLYTIKATRDGPVEENVTPDRLFVEAILGRGEYPGARRLRGVTTGPIVHPDGSILASPGYDPITGYLCAYDGPSILVPSTPSREDAQHALAQVVDMIDDFPFSEPCHRSAYLALVFTLLLRPTIRGSAPIFPVTANSAGGGKTLLVNFASMVVYGGKLPCRPYTDDDRELTATIVATLAEGASAALFDNVDRPFGGPTMDLTATGDRVKVRRYGVNDTTIEVEAATVLIATGNNLAFRGDLARRVIIAQLDVLAERPESRAAFRYPELLQTTTERRGDLLAALLTIVRAFIAAGRPRAAVSPMGSFEIWASWVRDLLIWLGEADPVESQSRVRDEQDAVLVALLDAWEAMFGLDKPVTIHEALEAIQAAETHLRGAFRSDFDSVSETSKQRPCDPVERIRRARALEGAFKDLGMASVGNASAVALGKRFRPFARRRCQGRMFVSVIRGKTNAWAVEATTTEGTSDDVPSVPNVPSVAEADARPTGLKLDVGGTP